MTWNPPSDVTPGMARQLRLQYVSVLQDECGRGVTRVKLFVNRLLKDYDEVDSIELRERLDRVLEKLPDSGFERLRELLKQLDQRQDEAAACGVPAVLDDVLASLASLDAGRQAIDPREKIVPNDSFNCVRWGARTFEFKAGPQADCMRIMYSAWKKGVPWIDQKEIIAAADTNGDRLRDKFRDHPAWGSLIVASETEGIYGLADPPDA